MFKLRRKTIKEEDKTNPENTIFDVYLNDSKRVLFRLVFSMAQVLKVTPKQLAGAFSKKKITEYAAKFNEELAKAEESILKSMTKSIQKKGKK